MRTRPGLYVAALLAVCQGCGVGGRTSLAYVPVEDASLAQATRASEESRTLEALDAPDPKVQPDVSAPSTNAPASPDKPAATKEAPVKAEPAANVGPPVKLVRGNPNNKTIALTFDDGPHAGFTEELLRLLKELDVKATFFFIGRNVDANPDLAKEAVEAGMEVAGHTYSHSRLLTLSDDDVKIEIVHGLDAIEKATGVRPRFYRPPGGEYDERIAEITKKLQLTMVLWTSDAGDYTTPMGNPLPETIYNKVMKFATPGGIIIMHDPMPSSLKALPSIVLSLRARGYKFVTVSELAEEPGAVFVGGPRITPRHAALVQELAEQGRYPSPNSSEAKNASPEQRAEVTTSPQGPTGQGTDQGGQGRQVPEVQSGSSQGTQTGRAEGHKKARRSRR